MPDIFTYVDYRKFLADRVRELKVKNPNFSHRYVSKKVGYGSAGFFGDVVAGRKNLTGRLLIKLAGILDLRKDEEEYFINLALYNQSQTVDEKNRYYEKLMDVTRIDVKILETGQFEYFSHWYNAAIRELLAFYPFTGDYKALGKKLDPSISPAQSRKAIQLMMDAGMLTQAADGSFRPTEALVSTGEGFAALKRQ